MLTIIKGEKPVGANTSVNDLRGKVKSLIKFGKSDYEIISILSKSENTHQSVIEDLVKDVIFEFPNYGFIQKIVRSKLVCNVFGEVDKDKLIVIDEDNRNIESFCRSRVFEAFDSKVDLKSRIYTAKFKYMPYQPGCLVREGDGMYLYNLYSPPPWQIDWFYSYGKIPVLKEDKLPKLYEDFFWHLVGKDSKSFEYLIKWLANAVQDRNYCILTTIGEQGIGKGVLGEIMRKIFDGPMLNNNYYAGGDRMFKGTFNHQLTNKRMVYCDEIKINNVDEENRLKLVVNDMIEIEQKGVDAKEIENYASFYVSSNQMDSIGGLSANDRRFSIIELTDIKLSSIMKGEQIDALMDEDNVSALARYLWYFPVDKDEMLKVFVSERTSHVRAMGLKEWEEWFIMEYCPANPGKQLKITEAGDIVKDHFGWSTKVGRGRFIELKNKYPDKFQVRLLSEGEARSWIIEIA